MKNTQAIVTVNALCLLAVGRMLKNKAERVTDPDDVSQVEPIAEGLEAEIKNIIIEHLETKDIVEMCATLQARRIMGRMDKMCRMILAINGDLDKEQLLAAVARTCSHALGREVEI